MVERVLVHQMRFVDEEDRKSALASEVFDVFAHRMEYVACGGTVRDAEGMADVSIEVAPAERDVVTVGEPDRLVGAECMAKSAQHAGFADTGLAGHDGVFSLVYAGHELVHEAALAVG